MFWLVGWGWKMVASGLVLGSKMPVDAGTQICTAGYLSSEGTADAFRSSVLSGPSRLSQRAHPWVRQVPGGPSIRVKARPSASAEREKTSIVRFYTFTLSLCRHGHRRRQPAPRGEEEYSPTSGSSCPRALTEEARGAGSSGRIGPFRFAPGERTRWGAP